MTISNGLYTAKLLGQTPGLKLVLDVGDRSSYDPEVQAGKWLDISGNGYDFDRDGPTFNGSPGGLSDAEFWSFDDDRFVYGSANEPWMENLHKAGAKLGIAAWTYTTTVANAQTIMATRFNSNDIGVRAIVQSGRNINFQVGNGSGTNVLSVGSTVTIPADTWGFYAVSVNEAAGEGIYCAQGLIETFAATYLSPSASNASFAMNLASANGVQPLNVNARMTQVWMWEGVAPTAGQLKALFNSTRGRYGV